MSSLTLRDFSQKKYKQELLDTGEENSNILSESHIIVCGAKDSGKTTLINKFLEKDDPAKPTIALDFCYGRRSKPNNMSGVKDVTNVSEIGGGKSTVKLFNAVISKQNLSGLVIVLVVDLSKPSEIWEVQHAILTQIKQRITAVLNEQKKTNPELEKELMKKAWQRVGAVHTDKNMISPLMVPLVIIGTKYDLFQELSTSKKEMVSKALRFVNHYHGGMIQYFSTKAEGLSSRTKSVFSHVAFKTSLSKTASIDPGKPLIVPFGADSLELVGAPPVSSDRMMKNRGNSPYELWQNAYESVFPSQNSEDTEVQTNPTLDKNFADETIDNARKQKDQELERYRKLSERKSKENKLNASAGVSSSKKKQK